MIVQHAGYTGAPRRARVAGMLVACRLQHQFGLGINTASNLGIESPAHPAEEKAANEEKSRNSKQRGGNDREDHPQKSRNHHPEQDCLRTQSGRETSGGHADDQRVVA